jgi:putative CocE/NonD family hydrolase
MTRRRLIGCALTAALLAAALAAAAPEYVEARRNVLSVTVGRNVEARMRDGVVLRADVYRPDAPGRYPALVHRTPYSKRVRNDAGYRGIASRGYVVVTQDTRGRYMSDGVARPHDEAQDGYDTVEWAAKLPYVNGKVGMFGGSYAATTQLLAASLRPPSLVALFPSSSYDSRYNMVFQGGAFYLADGLSWNLGQAADVRRRMLTPQADRDGSIGITEQQRRLLRDRWLWHTPLKTMDALELRKYAPAYFEMLAHPSYDEYWTTFDIAARHGEFEVPALHLTGWYDTLVATTLRNFAGLRAKARTERARAHQRVIVGPWTHARPGPDSTKIGDVDFGAEAGFETEDLMLGWFDHWLRDGGADVIKGAPVRIFVMGENKWRDEQEWPLARAQSTPFYLRSGGRANTSSGDGRLERSSASAEGPDRFVYDPWDPVPTGPLGGYSRSPSDQREIEARDDVLVYSTPPLDSDLEVTGPIQLVLWAASSARDTDFTAKLVDVHPDGAARALTDGILRARYRFDARKPQLLVPGEPTELTIDVGVTSNLFKRGHRIRLEVSSSNFPRFDRNPHTGDAFGESAELRRAEQTIFHDARRPSRLILPVTPR